MDPASFLVAAALVVIGYLSGSLPIGVIVAKLSRGPDPRTIGSGRTGGTNVLRALGRRWAALVVLGDLAKGALPVLLARIVTDGHAAVEVAAAFAAVIGSFRSVFLHFGGGRGVGTGVGTMLVIQPFAVLLATPVFIIVILVTRYVSLGSLIGSASLFPATLIVYLVLNGSIPVAYVIYAAIGPVLIWISHADNINRLIHGTERKFDLGMLAGRRGG